MPRLLDTRRRVETPEGVHLELSVAGPVARGWAWLFDLMGRGLVYSVVGPFLIPLGDAGTGILLIVMFLVEWGYPVVFEVFMQGATPGKRLMGLQVVHADGSPVGWTAAVLRNLLRVADFLPFAFLAGLVSMLLSEDFRRIGDHVAGTVVVHADRRAARLPATQVRPEPPPFSLELAEQRAIVDFAERSGGWTEDRVEELAEVLVPAMGGPPQTTARRLHGVARWLLGERP